MDRSTQASSVLWNVVNSGTWLQRLSRPRLAVIYEQRVARICRGCRADGQRVADGLFMAATPGSGPTMVDNLERRSDLFVECCKEEWRGLHFVSMFLSGTISLMLTNQGMWTNIIARTAALLSLEFAIASAVYAAMYVRRIVPATKNFPYILRHAARYPNEYTHVWAVFALPLTYLACSILLLAIAFLVFVWTPEGMHAVDISARLRSYLLLVIGIVHPFCRSFHAWETFNNLCQPVKMLDDDKV